MSRKTNSNDWRERFRLFAAHASHAAGSPWSFLGALLIVAVWGLSGPVFGFSDTWQLVINTATTIVTFLMVFLIQNTQNRDARAIHLKLDELIKNNKHARNRLVDLEEVTEDELDRLEKEFRRMRQRSARRRKRKQSRKNGRTAPLSQKREPSAQQPAP